MNNLQSITTFKGTPLSELLKKIPKGCVYNYFEGDYSVAVAWCNDREELEND